MNTDCCDIIQLERVMLFMIKLDSMLIALLNVAHWDSRCIGGLKASRCYYFYFQHKVGGSLNLEVQRQLTCTFTSRTKLLCVIH